MFTSEFSWKQSAKNTVYSATAGSVTFLALWAIGVAPDPALIAALCVAFALVLRLDNNVDVRGIPETDSLIRNLASR